MANCKNSVTIINEISLSLSLYIYVCVCVCKRLKKNLFFKNLKKKIEFCIFVLIYNISNYSDQ